MRNKGVLIAVFLVLTMISATFAQRKKKVKQIRTPQQELSYSDKNYLSEIKTVEFYNIDKEQSLPLIRLNTGESFFLSFDDLRADNRNFYYSIEHCDVDWKKSNLSQLEYSSGFGEERITESANSRNTLQAYTHYQTQFPTENTRPLLSGNYLLKVYEDGDKSRLILSRRFYVLDEQTAIQARVVQSLEVKNRKSDQKIDVIVNTQRLDINNPTRDIKVMVMQNNRQDCQIWSNNPNGIRDNELTYNQVNHFNFKSGQEFLYTDLRSFRLQSSMMESLKIDSSVYINLRPDSYLDNMTYSETIDENGRFYIRNMDEQGNIEILNDYAEVTFRLNWKVPKESEIYLLGAFNNFIHDEENKMIYDEVNEIWEINKLLKQGLYDYLYSSKSAPNFYQTKNSYQVIIYHRNPRLNRDEIVGFYELNSSL